MVKNYSVAAEKIYQRANRADTPAHLRKGLLKEADQQAKNDVFGVDHKTDRHGNPIENGLGSAGNQTRPSLEAYKKYHKSDPDYEETLKRIEAELAECDKTREDD